MRAIPHIIATALLIALPAAAQTKAATGWVFDGKPDRFTDKKRCHLNSPVIKNIGLSFQGADLYITAQDPGALIDGGTLKVRVDNHPTTESSTRNVSAIIAAADAYTITAGGALLDQMTKGKQLSIRLVTTRAGFEADFPLRGAAQAIDGYKRCVSELNK